MNIQTFEVKPMEQAVKVQEKSKIKITKRAKKRLQERSYRRWSQQENSIYALFLLKNIGDFSSEWNRRSTKVYLRLSQIIRSKSINQCKSHHQKMISYCGTIQEVIKKFLDPQIIAFLQQNPPINSIKQDDYNGNYVKIQPHEWQARQMHAAMYQYLQMPTTEHSQILVKKQQENYEKLYRENMGHFLEPPYPMPIFQSLCYPPPVPDEVEIKVGNILKEQQGVPNILKLTINEQNRI